MLGSLVVPFLLLSPNPSPAQEAAPPGRELIPNGGFEEGTTHWTCVLAPYGAEGAGWEAAAGRAEVTGEGAFQGRRCLRLNARGLEHEVDVYSDAVAVQPDTLYLLDSQVRQLAGTGAYKVVVDWRDGQGQHLAYANDWRGHDRPPQYAAHGGVFVSPPKAAQAALILGVGPGVECLSDDISLRELATEPWMRAKVPDGEGAATIEQPAEVPAAGHATFRLRVTIGEGGLPVGGQIQFRRSNTELRWSPVQTADPKAEGFTTATAASGARLRVQPGDAQAVPCLNAVVVEYPGLKAGDVVEIVYGDTSGGGPGAKAQPAAEPGIRFAVATDGDADGRARDLPDLPAFGVVPGPAVKLALIGPAVAVVGQPATFRVEAHDAEGNLAPDPAGAPELTIAHGRARVRGDGGQAVVTCSAAGPKALSARWGEYRGSVSFVACAAPRVPLPGDSPVLVGDHEVSVGNAHVRLVLPVEEGADPEPGERGPGEGGRTIGPGFLFGLHGQPSLMGTMPAIGELRFAGDDGEMVRVPMRATSAEERGDALHLAGAVALPGGDTCRFTATLRAVPERPCIEVSLQTRSDGPLAGCAVCGPALLVGDGAFGAQKTEALFPGLEYLTGDEVSSSTKGVAFPYSERWVPHPYKVTVPLVAVADGGRCAGLYWDPNQMWDEAGQRRCPAVEFASPNRLDDGANHHLALLAPGVLDGTAENARAPGPETTLPASGVRLAATLFAVPGGVTDAVRLWVERNGLPPVPETGLSPDEALERCLQAYLAVAWDGEKKGWHSALADPWGARYDATVAAQLSFWPLLRPGSALVGPARAQLGEAFGAVGGRPGLELSFMGKGAAQSIADLAERAAGAVGGQAADGSWAYHPHHGTDMFSEAHAKVIGPDGAANVGTCVMGLQPISQAARRTGDPYLVAATLKGLKRLDAFTRPQGAENWEVPLDCPNLRAAALAVECYLDGYEVTGDPDYLERAQYWGWAGLPFIYLWQPPDRPIMPYASISVMGTSFYTNTWFGHAVQWVGLVYAEALLRLAEADPGGPWRHAAEGIAACAIQQQKDASAPCGHTGLYPDSLSLLTGEETYHWCLSPTLIADCLYRLRGEGPVVTARVLRAGDTTVHVNAIAHLEAAEWTESRLRLALAYPEGQSHWVVISHLARPTRVLAQGEAVPESSAPEGNAWQYDQSTGLLAIRVRQTSPSLEVVVEAVPAAASLSLGMADAVVNGGFEEGLAGWSVAPAERGHLTTEAHTGRQALALDATGLAAEVQATSRLVRVEGGRPYRLSSFVRHVAGGAGYKVTIDWLGAERGHLSYDNDWQGGDEPAAFAEHGGVFTAPPQAAAARLILGVRPGASYSFDDIELRPAQ